MGATWIAMNIGPESGPDARPSDPTDVLNLFCVDVGAIKGVTFETGHGATLHCADGSTLLLKDHLYTPISRQAILVDPKEHERFPTLPERIPCRFQGPCEAITSIASRELGSRYGRTTTLYWIRDPRAILLTLYGFFEAPRAKVLATPLPTRAAALAILRGFGAYRPFPHQPTVEEAETLTQRMLARWGTRFPKRGEASLRWHLNPEIHTFIRTIRSAGTFAIPEAKAVVKALPEAARVSFVREPDNPHDPNAIRIRHDADGTFLGYVPKGIAAEWAPRLDGGERFIGLRCETYGSHATVLHFDVFRRVEIPLDTITQIRLRLHPHSGADEEIEICPKAHRLRRTWGAATLTLTFTDHAWETFAQPLLNACDFLSWEQACNAAKRGREGEVPFRYASWELDIVQENHRPLHLHMHVRPPHWDLFARFLEQSCDFQAPMGLGQITFGPPTEHAPHP